MSDRAAIKEIVLETLGQVLDVAVADLRADPALAVHKWDSLSSLEALAQLEKQLGVTFDLRSFNDASTVDDIVGLAVSEQLDAKN